MKKYALTFIACATALGLTAKHTSYNDMPWYTSAIAGAAQTVTLNRAMDDTAPWPFAAVQGAVDTATFGATKQERNKHKKVTIQSTHREKRHRRSSHRRRR